MFESIVWFECSEYEQTPLPFVWIQFKCLIIIMFYLNFRPTHKCANDNPKETRSIPHDSAEYTNITMQRIELSLTDHFQFVSITSKCKWY